MPVVTNFAGRVLGLLKRILGALSGLPKVLAHGFGVVYGPAAGLIALGFYTLAYNAVDSLLEANITLQSSWQTAFNGQVTSASITDILEKANYYFPIDTMGSLCIVYMSLWTGVYAYRNAKEVAANIDTFKGIFTK